LQSSFKIPGYDLSTMTDQLQEARNARIHPGPRSGTPTPEVNAKVMNDAGMPLKSSQTGSFGKHYFPAFLCFV